MGIDAFGVRFDLPIVEVKIGLHIELVEHQPIGGGEHERVFHHFVVPFRHAEQRDAEVFADVELRRTDQVPDVFHQDDVQIRQGELLEQVLDAHGLDMAGPVGVQLHHRDAHGVDGIRVHLAGDVALDDTDAGSVPAGG